MPETITHYRACNLCEAICGLKIEVRGKEILSIKGDPDDPLSRGHICPKAVALKDIYEDPDRLRKPVRRTAGGWQEISWEEAYAEVVAGLTGVQEKYGKDAVGVYLGNPTVHNWGSMLYGPEFLRLLQTKKRFSATSADQLPHHLAAYFMYGHYMAIPIPDVDRTHYMLILGANPLVSNGSLMTAPGMDKRLKAIQRRGGQVVVLDPRLTETAKMADRHHFIRPGKDVYFLLAFVHTLFEENLLDLKQLESYTSGVEQVAALVRSYAPERVATVTGVPAAAIRQLVREFAAAPSAVCYGRMGLSTQEFGGLCQWLIQVVNILTGNLDRPGGAMFALPAFDLVAQQVSKGKRGSFGRWKSRIRGIPEFGGELPVAELAEEMLSPGEGQIKALVTSAGNPVLSTPNGRLLDKALSDLDFMVSIDIYINETTRHANIILPPATGLETDHYDMIFHIFAVRNTARYSPALFERGEDQRYDWEIFRELALQMGGKPSAFSPKQMLAYALPFGPYASEGITLDYLQQHPHGLDLGPLQVCLPERLFTPDRQINLIPEVFTAALAKLEIPAEEPEDSGTLLLIGRRQLRSNNSWMHNSYRLVKGGDRCTVLINPSDAEVRGISQGQEVEVSSAVGKVVLAAVLSEEMMPGVVSIPHGWGHARSGISLSVAAEHPGVSVNDLTDNQKIDELSGNAVFSGIPIEVVRI